MIDSRGEAVFLPVQINELEFNPEELFVLPWVGEGGEDTEGDRSWKQETEMVKERKEPVLVMMIKRWGKPKFGVIFLGGRSGLFIKLVASATWAQKSANNTPGSLLVCIMNHRGCDGHHLSIQRCTPYYLL